MDRLRKKKVLYVTYDGLTDPLGQSQILPYLQGLSKLGYQFTILSFEKEERLKREENLVRDITEKYGIKWVPLLFTSKPPVLAKMYDRYRIWQTANSLHKKNGFDLIHCRSYIAAEVGLRLKKKYGVRMLFDMRGFWADEKLDNGHWDQQKLIYRYIYSHYKKKEKDFLLNADGIVSLTKAAKNHLCSQPSYKHLNIDVIPCCADLDHFDYKRINKEELQLLKKELQIPADAKVLTYLGSVGGWYLTKEMFAFFSAVLQINPGYVMLVLTKDNAGQVIAEAIECGLPPEKIFVTYSVRKMLPHYLALSTASIFFIKKSFSKTASSPTKHAELMGMGIPVLCNDIGDTGHIIEQTKTGVLLNEFSEREFEACIKQLPALAGINKELIRKHAEEIFDLKIGIKKYESVYQKILFPLTAPVTALHV